MSRSTETGVAIAIAIICPLFAACHSQAPNPTTEQAVRQLKSNERLGWDQQADSAAAAAAMHFVVYVDNTPADMLDVSCTPTLTPAGFSCSGRLPPITPGIHTLQLASMLPDGTRRSTLSEPLRVEVGDAGASNR